MHPEFWTVPGLGISIKSYGLCLMIGFLTGVWLAMRRAARVKCDPDMVLNISFMALIGGVVGARLMYVIHYWESAFANQPNKWLAAINLTTGGLEFLGGFLGAFACVAGYVLWKRASLRLYADILAPSVMWGLAIGRIGCYLNGCCFGGTCDLPWAVRFPYGSGAFMSQWEERRVPIPAELLLQGMEPIDYAVLNRSPEQLYRARADDAEAREALETAKSEHADAEALARLQARVDALAKAKAEAERDNQLAALESLTKMRSREHPERPISPSELREMASALRSLPVHPTQLYESLHALVLCGLLTAFFRVRRRHGAVCGLLLICYPIGRFLIEMIRTDNPHDVVGLTISQFLSLGLAAGGLVYLYLLYRHLPPLSPLARAWVPPKEEA